MNREDQINTILKQRLLLANKIEDVEKSLEALRSKFDNLEELGQQIVKNLNSSKVTSNLRRLSLPKVQQNIQEEIEKVRKLKLRFSRETLNIGVIGQARQGKSRLLQSLTGLTADEIPDGNLLFCTGVRSNIYHRPNQQTSGIVHFYSEQEFLDEVIGLYYDKLGNHPIPSSIESFEKSPPSSPQSETAKLQNMHRHLIEDYHSNLDKYYPLLRGSRTKHITKAQIREHVAQADPQGKSFFNYLAVRKVDIFCEFPNSELGKVMLIDMPGLGDTRLGDEERLVKALEEDVDFVLFVRKPDELGGGWSDKDIDLYDKAQRSLSDLARRSFFILNRTTSEKGGNLHVCQALERTAKSSSIKVAKYVIVDCSDKAETGEVLNQVLNYLVTNITNLDREIARSTQEQLKEFQQSVDDKLSEALSVLAAYDEDSLFEDQFRGLWSTLTSGLEDLIERLKERRNLEEFQFKSQVEATLAKCRSEKRIPSISEIKERKDSEEGFKPAYYSFFPEIRAHLSQQFLSLDGHLQYFLEGTKVEVTRVLAEEGGLSGLSTNRGSEFLRDISHLVNERRNDGKHNELKLGFQHLSGFNVSYAGIVQRQIRQHLDELTPDHNELQSFRSPVSELVLQKALEWVLTVLLGQISSGMNSISIESLPSREKILDYLDDMLQADEVEEVVNQVLRFFNNLASDSGHIPFSMISSRDQVIGSFHAEQIREALSIRCDEVIDKCEQTLRRLLCEPNQIAYAMVREFIDLIRRTEKIEKEWRILLKREQSRVWSEFGQIIEYSEDRRSWLYMLTEAREINQLPNYQFLDSTYTQK